MRPDSLAHDKNVSSRMSGCDGTSFACEEPEVQECAGSYSKSEVGPEPRKRGPPTRRNFTSALFLTNPVTFRSKIILITLSILYVLKYLRQLSGNDNFISG